MREREVDLHIAAAKGCIDEVARLLMLGADPNAKDKHGCTPLCHADPCCVPVLIEYGADPEKSKVDVGWRGPKVGRFGIMKSRHHDFLPSIGKAPLSLDFAAL